MNTLTQLIDEVEQARAEFIREASGLTPQQSEFKPAPDVWSVKEVVEHIAWAEQAGVLGMWKVSKAMKENGTAWQGENPNQGLTIEAVVEKTWQSKEKVPEVAKPHWGGPVEYWLAILGSYRHTLLKLAESLDDMDPEQIIYPHPISGPLNVLQRMQFLRFHMQRHQQQIRSIKSHPAFPAG